MPLSYIDNSYQAIFINDYTFVLLFLQVMIKDIGI